MAKASEGVLGELHAAVAAALVNVIEAEDANGIPICTAAHLGAAITFLKNNNITADPDTNAGLAALRETLKNKRADSKARMAGNKAAADDLEKRLAGEIPGLAQ